MGASDGGRTLTKGQREVLTYLAGAQHATTNTIWDVFHRRGMGQTLVSLEGRGFVRSVGSSHTLNRRWDVTDEGRIAVGYRRWRIQFIGASDVFVIAATAEDARRGPWNPSFGIILNVEDVTDE